MIDLLNDLFSVIGKLMYKFLNTRSSVFLLIGILFYILRDMVRVIGHQLKVGDDNDNSNS